MSLQVALFAGILGFIALMWGLSRVSWTASLVVGGIMLLVVGIGSFIFWIDNDSGRRY